MVRDLLPGPANDNLELDDGTLVPMIEDAIAVDRPRPRVSSFSTLASSSDRYPASVRLDVFTQVPHAFGWLTEQRPVATVLGTELDLRLFNYRDTTPLRAGQVDDSPYGGGAGMVLRVDVVAAALDAIYGDEPPGSRDCADAPGAPARSGARRGARRRAGDRSALLAVRGLRRTDRRPSLHRRGLDRAVRPLGRRAAGDGARRRDRAAGCRAHLRTGRGRTRASARRSTAESSTRTTRARRSSEGWEVPEVLLSATRATSTAGGPSRADCEVPYERHRGSSGRRASGRARPLGAATRCAPEARPPVSPPEPPTLVRSHPARTSWAPPAGSAARPSRRRSTPPPADDPAGGYGWPMPDGRTAGERRRVVPASPRARRASAAASRATLAESRRPAHARSPERASGHDRLGRHDRRGDRDRPAREGLRRQPVPDSVVIDGADAALLAACGRV